MQTLKRFLHEVKALCFTNHHYHFSCQSPGAGTAIHLRTPYTPTSYFSFKNLLFEKRKREVTFSTRTPASPLQSLYKDSGAKRLTDTPQLKVSLPTKLFGHSISACPCHTQGVLSIPPSPSNIVTLQGVWPMGVTALKKNAYTNKIKRAIADAW